MRFEYEKDNSKIIFSWKERLLLLFKGKLEFTDVGMKHFCNNLFAVLVNFQKRFDPKVQKMMNNPTDELKTK
jgi:hypothetical protein|tara:strand:- start:182 stop:397 length:216 start_codon:yes stop_codon:yes gene_type:complete